MRTDAFCVNRLKQLNGNCRFCLSSSYVTVLYGRVGASGVIIISVIVLFAQNGHFQRMVIKHMHAQDSAFKQYALMTTVPVKHKNTIQKSIHYYLVISDCYAIMCV